MRFDWYQATFGLHSSKGVLGGLEAAFGPGAEARPCAPLYGYGEGYTVVQGDLVRATVLTDSEDVSWLRRKHVHAWAVGEDTVKFAEHVRNAWPKLHLVTRMDAAEDFLAPGSFDQLLAACRARATADKVKTYHAGDWERLASDDGRTLYLGAPSSDVRVRLYEKGKQLRGQLHPGGEPVSTDWTRLEVQVRPQGDARLAAASMTPEEVWGCAKWTQALLSDVTGLNVRRVKMRLWRKSDDQRAFEWMCKQYGRMLERQSSGLGGWSALGFQIASEIEAWSRIRRDGWV